MSNLATDSFHCGVRLYLAMQAFTHLGSLQRQDWWSVRQCFVDRIDLVVLGLGQKAPLFTRGPRRWFGSAAGRQVSESVTGNFRQVAKSCREFSAGCQKLPGKNLKAAGIIGG